MRQTRSIQSSVQSKEGYWKRKGEELHRNLLLPLTSIPYVHEKERTSSSIIPRRTKENHSVVGRPERQAVFSPKKSQTQIQTAVLKVSQLFPDMCHRIDDQYLSPVFEYSNRSIQATTHMLFVRVSPIIQLEGHLKVSLQGTY